MNFDKLFKSSTKEKPKVELPEGKYQREPCTFTLVIPYEEVFPILAYLAANCKLHFPKNGSMSEILDFKSAIQAQKKITYSTYEPATLFYVVKEFLQSQPHQMVPRRLMEPFLKDSKSTPDLEIFFQHLQDPKLLDYVFFTVPRLCSLEGVINQANLKKAIASLFSVLVPQISDSEEEKQLMPVLLSLFNQRGEKPPPESVKEFSSRMSMNISNLGKNQTLSVPEKNEKWIDLYSFHKKYITCERSGEVTCNRDQSRNFEKWNMIEQDDPDEIVLKSWNGRYLAIDEKENLVTISLFKENRCVWLKQNIILGIAEKHNRTLWSLTNKQNRKLLCCERTGKLIVNRTRRGEFEVFGINMYANLCPVDPKAK